MLVSTSQISHKLLTDHYAAAARSCSDLKTIFHFAKMKVRGANRRKKLTIKNGHHAQTYTLPCRIVSLGNPSAYHGVVNFCTNSLMSNASSRVFVMTP